MTLYSDIQSIAKTKELTEKVDKALTEVETAKKEKVPVKRATALQTGPGVPYTSSGNNGSGGIQNGKDADGNPVEAPLAPPPKQNTVPPQTQTSGDAYNDSKSDGETDTKDGEKDTDKSNKGEEKSNNNGSGNTRSDSKDQADPSNATGPNAEDWQKIEDAMEAAGATPEEIAAARRQYWTREKGTNEVSDVYNGDAGYTPDQGNWTSLAPNSGDYSPRTSNQDVLNALLGVDPDDVTLAVRINLDGYTPSPSVEESEAFDQGYWTDADTPPLIPGDEDFQQGYYWSIPTGYDPPNIFGATPTIVAKELPSILDANEPDHAPHFFISVTQDSEIAYTATYGRMVGGNFTYPISRVSCESFPNTALCPTDPPREEFWPEVGLWMLTKGPGGFSPNRYDSEVPLPYKQDNINKVRIKSAITGDVYTVENGANGGFILSNETNPNYFLYFGADRTLKTVAPMDYFKFYKAKVK